MSGCARAMQMLRETCQGDSSVVALLCDCRKHLFRPQPTDNNYFPFTAQRTVRIELIQVKLLYPLLWYTTNGFNQSFPSEQTVREQCPNPRQNPITNNDNIK